MRELSDLLPERYFNSRELSTAAGLVWVLGEVLRERALDLLRQLDLDRATWGLKLYERDYGIDSQATDTLDERRGRIRAKMRGAQTVTADMVQNICASYIDGDNIVTEYPRDSKISIQFCGPFGVPTNIPSLTAALLEVMPAHVVFDYLYRYLLVREVQTMTLDDLQGRKIGEFAF